MKSHKRRQLTELETQEFVKQFAAGINFKKIRSHFTMGEPAFNRIVDELNLIRPTRTPHNKPDAALVGQKYSFLTITGFEYDAKYKIWKATLVCDCGVTGKAKLLQLRNGERKTCGKKGCPHFHDIRRTNGRSGTFTGCEEIYGSRWGGWRCGAAARNLEFSVTPEFGWELFIKQNRKCALSGIELEFGNSWNKQCTASLDRVDSSKGYTEDNVQWVHKQINLMKRDQSDENFIKWCSLVLRHRQETNSNAIS